MTNRAVGYLAAFQIVEANLRTLPPTETRGLLDLDLTLTPREAYRQVLLAVRDGLAYLSTGTSAEHQGHPRTAAEKMCLRNCEIAKNLAGGFIDARTISDQHRIGFSLKDDDQLPTIYNMMVHRPDETSSIHKGGSGQQLAGRLLALRQHFQSPAPPSANTQENTTNAARNTIQAILECTTADAEKFVESYLALIDSAPAFVRRYQADDETAQNDALAKEPLKKSVVMLAEIGREVYGTTSEKLFTPAFEQAVERIQKQDVSTAVPTSPNLQ